MKRFLYIFWLFIFSIFFSLNSPLIQANIIISETYPNPNNNESEWIELFNTTENSISLDNWELWDQKSQPTLIYKFLENKNINKHEYLVIPVNNILNNSGDSILLFDENHILQDSLTYTFSEKNYSWAKNEQEPTNIYKTSPTWGKKNIIPTPTPILPTPSLSLDPTPTLQQINNSDIFPNFSEVVACPISPQKEWLEITNNFSTPINLTGYIIRDATHQIYIFSKKTLNYLEYITLEFTNTLNNGGDSLFLISPQNNVVDTFSYETCSKNMSWSKFDNQWLESSIITKGKININSEENSSEVSATTKQTTINLENSKEKNKIKNDVKKFKYPSDILSPEIQLPDQNLRHLQSIFFSPPDLIKGAINVIMGSLLLLIPGLVYVKKNKQNF